MQPDKKRWRCRARKRDGFQCRRVATDIGTCLRHPREPLVFPKVQFILLGPKPPKPARDPSLPITCGTRALAAREWLQGKRGVRDG